MCTTTWIWETEGYRLFFNRDERRSRPRAEAPAVRTEGGIELLAPRDPEGGGTWLAVNARGLSLGLLNFYDAPAPRIRHQEESFVSRGRLVTALAAARSLAQVEHRLRSLDLAAYRPFSLLALSPPGLDAERGTARVFEWDGDRFVCRPEPLPRLLSSSGYDAPTAYRHRRQLLATLDAESPAALREYHRSHQPERGAFSPCMHRDDASTVSFSAVTVGQQQIAFEYSDGPPCVTPLAAPVVMGRQPVV
jgi:hypothetical protein